MDDYVLTAVTGKTGVEVDEAFLADLTDSQLFDLMIQAMMILVNAEKVASKRDWPNYEMRVKLRKRLDECLHYFDPNK